MIYPEGQTVRVGDIVWTNEGINIRRIIKILESPEDIQKEYETEQGILYTSDLSGICDDILGFEAAADFEYEGIGLLSSDELLLVSCLHKMWCASLPKNSEKSPYACMRYPIKIEDGSFEQRWFFYFYIGNIDSYFMFRRDSLEFVKLTNYEFDKIRGQI